MRSEHPTFTLQHFFSGLAEYVFQTQLGVADPPLVDYVSDLICRFVRWDALFSVRDLAGRPVHEVAEMMAAAEHPLLAKPVALPEASSTSPIATVSAEGGPLMGDMGQLKAQRATLVFPGGH